MKSQMLAESLFSDLRNKNGELISWSNRRIAHRYLVRQLRNYSKFWAHKACEESFLRLQLMCLWEIYGPLIILRLLHRQTRGKLGFVELCRFYSAYTRALSILIYKAIGFIALYLIGYSKAFRRIPQSCRYMVHVCDGLAPDRETDLNGIWPAKDDVIHYVSFLGYFNRDRDPPNVRIPALKANWSFARVIDRFRIYKIFNSKNPIFSFIEIATFVESKQLIEKYIDFFVKSPVGIFVDPAVGTKESIARFAATRNSGVEFIAVERSFPCSDPTFASYCCDRFIFKNQISEKLLKRSRANIGQFSPISNFPAENHKVYSANDTNSIKENAVIFVEQFANNGALNYQFVNKDFSLEFMGDCKSLIERNSSSFLLKAKARNSCINSLSHEAAVNLAATNHLFVGFTVFPPTFLIEMVRHGACICVLDVGGMFSHLTRSIDLRVSCCVSPNDFFFNLERFLTSRQMRKQFMVESQIIRNWLDTELK